MSRKGTIALGLLLILLILIAGANAVPKVMPGLEFSGFDLGEFNLKKLLQEPPPIIGWHEGDDYIEVIRAPSGHSWSEISKKDSNCTLPSGEIEAGDRITNCRGHLVLVHEPSNTVVKRADFPDRGSNSKDENNDTDESDTSDNEDKEPDEVDTGENTIEITKPIEKLYIQNIESGKTGNPLILGEIDIKTSLQSQEDVQIKQVSFYIDDNLKHEDTTAPYNWTWDEKIIGKYTIKVEAYDSTDNLLDSDQIEVSIFNLGLK